MPRPLTKDERSLQIKLRRDAQDRATVEAAVTPAGNAIFKDAYHVPTTRKLLYAIEAEFRYTKLRRKAYICDGGQVRHTNDLGYGTITDAFISRPKGCKYCVFETASDTAVLVNMFELTQSGNPLDLTVKEGTTQQFDSVDAAIMYALTID